MEGEKYLFVVSAPRGWARTASWPRSAPAHPEIEKTVSITTRAPREGEAEGVNYYYRTQEEFDRLLAEGEILESNCFNHNCYGTLKSEVEKRMAAGKPVLLNIDVHGAANIKRLYPGSTSSSCCPPPGRSWNTGCGAGAPTATPT